MVWVGYDDNEPLGLSGAQAALPIWTEFMKTAMAGRPNAPFEVPRGLSFVEIDKDTGKLAGPGCERTMSETVPRRAPSRPSTARSTAAKAAATARRIGFCRGGVGLEPAIGQVEDRPRQTAYNSPVNQEVFAALAAALEKGEPVALVTITGSTGSTPQRVGAKMLVYADGRTVGTIGGGCYENEAFWKAREAIKSRKPLNMSFELNDDFAQETGLVCGGQMDVFIEPVEASPELYVFGAGHVGYFVGRMAHEVGFRVHVVDDREKFASAERFGPGIDVIVDDIPTWLDTHPLPATAYAVIVTRGHRHDLDALRALTARPLRYLGLIGSKAKVKRIFDALREEGVTPDQLRPVHAPIGLDIGAITPQEIAVSIVAELIAVKHGKIAEASVAALSMRWEGRAEALTACYTRAQAVSP